MEIYSSDLKLTGEDTFASDWNYVSNLYERWIEDEADENWQAYFNAKLALEQGLPVV